MQVAKWGNSLAVRLPVALVQDLGLKLGSEIEFKANSNTSSTQDRLLVEMQVKRSATKLERLQAVNHLRGSTALADYQFDRDEANAR
jgi:antitoxin MazE